MEMTGTVSGMIELLGGGEGKVNDVKVKENVSSDFVSVLNETDKTAYIDLSNKANTTDVENALETKQDTLTAGENITIENGIISALGGSWDYSTSEVNTGQKWIDGRTIYARVYDAGTNLTVNYNSWLNLTEFNQQYELMIEGKGINEGGTSTPLLCSWTGSVDNKVIQVQTPRNSANQTVRYFIFKYVKTSE